MRNDELDAPSLAGVTVIFAVLVLMSLYMCFGG